MIQIIYCPKCGSGFAGCVEPECYTDNNWIKEMKKYIKQGYKVKTVEKYSLEKCTCK